MKIYENQEKIYKCITDLIKNTVSKKKKNQRTKQPKRTQFLCQAVKTISGLKLDFLKLFKLIIAKLNDFGHYPNMNKNYKTRLKIKSDLKMYLKSFKKQILKLKHT